MDFDEELNKILSHIQRSVKELNIPLSRININILKDFNNLRSIIIDNIDSYILKYLIGNTNIKNIKTNNISINELDTSLDLAYTNDRLLCGDIVVDRIDSSNDLNQDNSELNIVCFSDDFDKTNEYLDSFQIDKYKKITIKLSSGKVVIDKNNNKYNLDYTELDLNSIMKIYNILIQRNLEISNISISFSNDVRFGSNHVNYTDFDYKELDEISKKVNIEMNYYSFEKQYMSYERFRNFVEAIKYYRSLIRDYPLSPLEKMTFAYDIMKTFFYNENQENLNDSRRPHRILETDHIVCSGYTQMLEEIMYGLDPNIKVSDFGVTCFDKKQNIRGEHSRTIIKIDDDKYNIHGFYALDSTWDSIDLNGKEKYGEDYDALSLYHHFLVPFTDYQEVFPYDSKPKFFQGKLKSLNDNLTVEEIKKCQEELSKKEVKEESKNDLNKEENSEIYIQEFNNAFYRDKKNDEEILKDFLSRRLKFNEFLTLIENVRKAEGYNGKTLEDEISKIARINGKMYGVTEENTIIR